MVTLARGGSKGVPRKHVRDLCGKPVLAWTIEAVAGSRYHDDYAVSSDDQEILVIAEAMGAYAIPRPADLATDKSPTLPALRHAVSACEAHFDKEYRYIVEIRATAPLMASTDIDGAVELLVKSGADSVIGVTKLEDHHPYRAKWLDGQGYIRDFMPEPKSGRRQDCKPEAYIRNGTIYAFKRMALMGPGGKLFGHENSLGYCMPPERSVNIDTEMDFKMCTLLMQERIAA